MDEDKVLQSAALKWLYEMELLNSPTLKQNLFENIFYSHRGIKDCEIFVTRDQKGVLVWVKLKLFAKLFQKTEIYGTIESTVKALLPSYRCRVVEDRQIFDLALEKAREMLGGKNDQTNANDSNADSGDGNSEGQLRQSSDLLSDSKESAVDRQEVRDETEQCDIQEGKKA